MQDVSDQQESHPDSPPVGHRHKERALLVLWALFLAVLVRWPLSGNLSAVPLDPNSPLHALALDQIASGGSWYEISNLAFPTPVPIRMVALPTLLLGLPFTIFCSPLAALNLATTLMVALQGLALAWLVGKLDWGRKAQFLAVTAGICAPLTIHVQSLGQQENLGFIGLALAVYAGLREGRSFIAYSIAALAIAAFSSPYQAVPTGILLVTICFFQNPKKALHSLGLAAIAAIPVLGYYTGATDGVASIEGITTSPPEEGYLASAGILDMLTPRAMLDGTAVSMDGPLHRLGDLQNSVETQALTPGWIWTTAHQSAYLGTILLLGILGIWRFRSSPLGRGLMLGAGVCLVFAMGPELRFVSEKGTGLPLPWAPFSLVPGLSDLQATHRFLSGAIFVFALGLAYWARDFAKHTVALIAALLMADGLLRSPVIWPLPAAKTNLHAVEASLPRGPVMLWPRLSAVAPQYYELIAVLLERPVGIYAPSGVRLSGSIQYDGPQQGYLRLDIVKKIKSSKRPEKTVHAVTLARNWSGPGTLDWESTVKVALGKVDILVFLDARGDGPDPNEPVMRIQNVNIGLSDVHNLDFQLTDPGITAEEVARSRNEPPKPGTRLPSDLPEQSGNLSQEEWLVRGAMGGARALLRSKLPTDDQDSGFNLSPQELKLGNKQCFGDHHCVQTLDLKLPPKPKRRP